jgi:hypothetical protein
LNLRGRVGLRLEIKDHAAAGVLVRNTLIALEVLHEALKTFDKIPLDFGQLAFIQHWLSL